MSKLIIYKKNGGKVYDIVMAQKQKKLAASRQEIQEKLIKELKKSSNRYESVWNSNLTVIHKGCKTGLYKELRRIIGICG